MNAIFLFFVSTLGVFTKLLNLFLTRKNTSFAVLGLGFSKIETKDLTMEQVEAMRIANLKELLPETPEHIILELHKLTFNEILKGFGMKGSEQALPSIATDESFSELTFEKLISVDSHNFEQLLLESLQPELQESLNLFLQISGEIFLFGAIFLIFCHSLLNSKRASWGYPLMQTNTVYLCVLAIILTIFLMSSQNILNFDSDAYSYSLFQNHFMQNNLYLTLKELLLFIVAVIFLLGLTYTRNNNNISYEFSLLLLLSAWAMCLLISSTDLISIYLIIELQSFCFYIITATKSNSNFSTEAGLKYFILGSFSSGLLLFGISILYGFTGLTNLEELKTFLFNTLHLGQPTVGDSLLMFNLTNEQNINVLAIVFSIILIIIGILFKFGLVPFHMYVPDVYTGAPTIVTTLFVVIQKFVILIVYINLYNSIFVYFFDSVNYFLVISVVASIALGSITALAQSKIKRLVAYSAIVNGGYLLLGLVIGTIDGLCSSLLFLFIYISLMITLFCIYIAVKNQYNEKKLAGFKDFILLKKGNIALALSFSLILFSIAGIPPLAGFYGKLFLFTSVIKEGSYALAIVAILFTVVTAYYYIRLVKIMFFEKTLKFGFFTQISKKDAYIIAIGTLFNLIFFAMPKLFFVFLNVIMLKFYFFF